MMRVVMELDVKKISWEKGKGIFNSYYDKRFLF